MKRSGFKRRVYVSERAPVTPIPADVALRVRTGEARLTVWPKVIPVEHAGYRRLVAAMPCDICGAVGRSQAAHANTGKGMGTKTDDRTAFPLCAPSPGDPGCHANLDQGGMFTKWHRRAYEEAAGRRTRQAIRNAGQWPADLEHWQDEGE